MTLFLCCTSFIIRICISEEELEEYLDSNYTKKELFDVLSGSDEKREEVLADIRSGVAEAIYESVSSDISWDYSEVTIEV